MASSSSAHRGNLDASAAAEAGRQRSILAKLITLVDPANGERLAQALLDEFRSIAVIWSQSPEALDRVLGASSPVTVVILGAREAALESMAADLRGVAIVPISAELRRYLIASMGSLADETLRILFLDKACRLIADEQLQRGSLSQLSIHPRTIFRRALEHNAAGIILVHNHPSGDPNPSDEDILVTRHLDQIGRSLDIEMVDHIIVTATHAHQMISRGAIAGKPRSSPTFPLRSPDRSRSESGKSVALANAESLNHRRLLRQQLIGASELFGDPAWEMLVDLFIHDCRGKELSITSLCVAVHIPMSTGLRLVQKLCDAGILRRIPDHIDGRRTIIKLEPAIAHRLRAYFEGGAE